MWYFTWILGLGFAVLLAIVNALCAATDTDGILGRRMYALPDAEASDGRGPGRFLMVATDSISAFDHVLSSVITDKGAVLTKLSLWWFDQLADLVPNHVVSADVPPAVAGRALVTERLAMIPVECVVRGYLTGSGWAEYRKTGTVTGIRLPEGLRDGDRLPEPIFTPAIKAELGEHDENVPFETIVEDAHVDRDLSRPPLFQAAFSYQSEPSAGIDLGPGVAAERVARPANTTTAAVSQEIGERRRPRLCLLLRTIVAAELAP